MIPLYREGGILVAFRMVGVRRCSQAYALGLRSGDALLAISGQGRLRGGPGGRTPLSVICAVYYATDTLRVTVLRRGEEVSLTYLLAPTDEAADAGARP